MRFHGAGGDGGVECFADLPDGNRVGWQAKYVFDIGSLLKQATESLSTALKIHPTLTRYVVCFPFDLTGPTERQGLSGQEKFDNWREEQKQKVVREGRQLTIEAWPASMLRKLLLHHDTSGGVREFFFNQQILTNTWFSEHLDLAKETAGPRYTPQLNVQTDLWKWFAAFGRTTAWSNEFRNKLRACRQAHNHIASTLRITNSDSMSPAWPQGLGKETLSITDETVAILDECDRLAMAEDPCLYRVCVNRIGDLLERLTSLELQLVNDLEAQHGQGKADSSGFRQFAAECMGSFPAAKLDSTRDTIAVLRDLHDWLRSPACSLAYKRVFVLSGVAGSGKTHGVCDTADRRFTEGLLTCVTFGHAFRGEPDPWTRLSESLGLPITLGMKGLLDALNAAGEASGLPLILCIDAINETRPLRYWRDRLSAVSQAIQHRPHLRLVITCRTPFIPHCLPDGHGLPIVEHAGFTGVERDACQTFFQHYELEPPISPILQPELSNPLYLRLVCETLRSSGFHRLPAGWHGLAPTIRAFLQEKERWFAAEYETSEGANMVSGSLMAIVRAIADAGDIALSSSHAQRVISVARPQASTMQVLEWLVREGLLIEDAPPTDTPLGGESVVRPAFERLGDFLYASELLKRSKQIGLDVAYAPGGLLHALWKDSDALERNSGVLATLSILLSEYKPELELPNLVEDESTHDSLLRITVQAFPSRDPATFSSVSGTLIWEALRLKNFSCDAMDTALAIAWQPSAIDAFWLDELLKRQPFAKRDAIWCGYLHDRFESQRIVYRLIHAAFELPLRQLDPEIAERWTTLLLWFNVAADRRVKDRATRAATVILTAKTKVIPKVLQRFIGCDDDEAIERVILSCYGALVISRDTDVIRIVTDMLQKTYRCNPEAFNNALVRDHIRCVSELAQELNVLPENCDPELTMQPISSIWPLELPSETQIEAWGELLHFRPNEFMSDFFKYSMNCLRPWEHTVPKEKMGEWILQRAAHDFGYQNSGCEEYDAYMLGKYGGGRSKPTWAERIGKKYQWIAMYQLASRLHDYVKRERNSWEPEPLRTPLILLEERKTDPTLPADIVGEKRDAGGWWMKSSANLGSTETHSDKEWVAEKDDIPALEELLSGSEHDRRNWHLLVSYPSWGRRDEDTNRNDPYRHVWMHLESYLVQKQDITTAYDCLHRRNFFGRWMPEGATWSYGFAGEYPWGTPFNTEPEEWHGRGGYETNLPVAYEPCWNSLAMEWGYDSSVPRNFDMVVPARTFFSLADLWWDGKDGYRLGNGKTVFRDPSVTEAGTTSLIADADELLDRLDKLGMCLIWTLLGKKLILGGLHDTQTPRRTFSQIALFKDGSLHVGERVFFDDYHRDTGPKIN